MTPKQLHYLTTLLLKQKKEIEKQVENPPIAWSNELSAYDNHPADMASETYEMDKERTLYDHQKRVLQQIIKSLQQINKVNKGNYGICCICKKEIPFERLAIIPYTNQCISCAENIKVAGPLDTRRHSAMKTPLNPDIELKQEIEIIQKLQSYGSSDNMQDILGMEVYEDIYEQYDSQKEEDPLEQISNEDYKKQLYD